MDRSLNLLALIDTYYKTTFKKHTQRYLIISQQHHQESCRGYAEIRYTNNSFALPYVKMPMCLLYRTMSRDLNIYEP